MRLGSPVLPITTHPVDDPGHIQLSSMCLIDSINSHICLEASTNKALHGFPNYFPN
jgi:molecular chaperone DnaK (HSP70)